MPALSSYEEMATRLLAEEPGGATLTSPPPRGPEPAPAAPAWPMSVQSYHASLKPLRASRRSTLASQGVPPRATPGPLRPPAPRRPRPASARSRPAPARPATPRTAIFPAPGTPSAPEPAVPPRRSYTHKPVRRVPRWRKTLSTALGVFCGVLVMGAIATGLLYGLGLFLRPLTDNGQQQPAYSPPAGTRVAGPPPAGNGHGVHVHVLHVPGRSLIYVIRGGWGGGRTGGTNSAGTP